MGWGIIGFKGGKRTGKSRYDQYDDEGQERAPMGSMQVVTVGDDAPSVDDVCFLVVLKRAFWVRYH